MPHLNTWTRQPQLKDLPRDSTIAVTCKACAKSWSRDVRDMVETQRLGAQFMDLLEWETRCRDAACNGAVVFAYDGKPEVAPYVAEVVTPPLPKVERPLWPVKAVVRPRQHSVPQYSLPQYTLPMSMPRTVQPARMASHAGR